jgi:hypothetical protein
MARSEIAESNTSSKRKYTKKRKVDEIDFSIITILELLECLSLIILTPANFWKTLTDILKKPKVEFNLKKILNKLHHNLKAFNMKKSEKSWNIILLLNNNTAVLDLRFLWVEFSVKLQLSGVSCVEYWELSNVFANTAIAILTVNMYW